MKKWNKKPVKKEDADLLLKNYGIDPLTASILIRRGITDGQDILFFMEKDKRFLHNPFLFSNMEDAVDRILQAQEEQEKVLIFGDRDVDGITSTTILYRQLVSMNIDVQWRLPAGNDGYGLSIDAVNDFYSQGGTLIITVDCGISNFAEIDRACDLGIDVIVLDHHNVQDKLPNATVVIDPKCPDSGYPFQDISGAAVAFKTVSALRFAESAFYKQEICLLGARKTAKETVFDCLKIQNLVSTDFYSVSVPDSGSSIYKTKLPEFLQGQAIYVWNGEETKKLMRNAFGSGVELNFLDAREVISKIIPPVSSMSLSDLKNKSKISLYDKNKNTEIQGFYNIFVTWTYKFLEKKFPGLEQAETDDLELAALAALADIMPLKNENRIIVNYGIRAMNEGKIQPGLMELLSKLDLLGKQITSTKLSWNVIPVLNATGRLGQPELGMELLLEKSPEKRAAIADRIIELNQKRKELGNQAWEIGIKTAQESIDSHYGKLCLIVDEKINRGVSGILAGKLVSAFNVPSIVVTFVDDVAIGSMRSCRGFSTSTFLDEMSDIFINHGGHDLAAGFSLKKENLEAFKKRVKENSIKISLEETEKEEIEIDAELSSNYLTPDILTLVDKFEPYGEGNPELNFLTRNLQILDAVTMGKIEANHLKLLLNCGKTKWPAVFFGEAKRLHNEFDKGDFIDVVYQIQRNCFNGNTTPQMILSETETVKK